MNASAAEVVLLMDAMKKNEISRLKWGELEIEAISGQTPHPDPVFEVEPPVLPDHRPLVPASQAEQVQTREEIMDEIALLDPALHETLKEAELLAAAALQNPPPREA